MQSSPMLNDLSEADLKLALAYASPTERVLINKILDELKQRELRERAQNDFMAFVEYIWPEFINGRHHRRMAKLFCDVASGREKRVIINLGPRHTKSEFTSYLLPAWLLGKFPNKKIMQVSNTSELAEGFGRKVRNLVGSERYREIFPDVELRQDSKAAGRWNTNKNGEYFATGVGGALAGRGADMCLAEFTKIIIDDDGVEKEIDLVDVQIGQKIKTVTSWEEVTRKKLTIHHRWVKINSDIEASPEHRFLTDKGWKMAGELRVGDRILTESLWSKLCHLINQITATLHKILQEKLGRG